MFERYSEQARRALFFARYEAGRLGSRTIESEHVLLGILREGEEVVGEIFRRFQVRPEDVRREIEAARVSEETIPSTIEMPLSEDSKKILAYASHEAESLRHSQVGSGHLLLGALRVEGCAAARILVGQGFDIHRVREELGALQSRLGKAAFERVIPILVYADIPAAHDFLVAAFGFESGGVERDGQGQAVHGEVRAGSTTFWLHRVTAEHEMVSPVAGGASAGFAVHVDDVDAHFERARAAGAQIDSAPEDKPYGQREYGARDLEGHRWWFATPTGAGDR